MKIPVGILAMTILLASCKEEPHAAPIDLVKEDPVKLDPTHYKVEFENDQVRLLHATYGPREKSPMHSHPDYAIIQATGASMRETNEYGKTVDSSGGPGVGSGQAMRHSMENLGDKPFESYILELKKSK